MQAKNHPSALFCLQSSEDSQRDERHFNTVAQIKSIIETKSSKWRENSWPMTIFRYFHLFRRNHISSCLTFDFLLRGEKKKKKGRKSLQSSITITSKGIYSVVSFMKCLRGVFFNLWQHMCLGKKRHTFITVESKLKYSCHTGFQIEIYRLPRRTPKSHYCKQPHVFILCLWTQIHPSLTVKRPILLPI